MIEHPNSNWDQFTNHVITKDLTFIVATDLANKSTMDKSQQRIKSRIKKLVQSMIRIHFNDVTLTSREDLTVHDYANIAEGRDILYLDIRKSKLRTK